MGVSDRLYEASCEVRDLETTVERLRRDHPEHDALVRGASELVEAIEEDRLTGVLPPLTDRTAAALSDLKSYIQR